VTVVENPVIGRIASRATRRSRTSSLRRKSNPSRGHACRVPWSVRRPAHRRIYRRSGRYDISVNPEIIEQPNNRVDLVFTITEGGKTGIKSVDFVGNNAYSSYRLKDIIKTHESNLLSFLGGGDVYDPDRSRRSRSDSPLLPQARVLPTCSVAALTEYDPEKKGFLVTFKIEEGQQYRLRQSISSPASPRLTAIRSAASRTSMSARSTMPKRWREIRRGNADRGLAAGYAFAIVRPRGDRNFERIPFQLPSPSTKARAPISSASTCAAIPAPATTSFAANSIFPRATRIIGRWSIAPSAG